MTLREKVSLISVKSTFSLLFRHKILIPNFRCYCHEGLCTVNFLNIWTPKKMCCNYPKSWTRWLFLRVKHPKDAEGIANSVDPNQTAPLGAIWSGSALFAQACPSQKIRKITVCLNIQAHIKTETCLVKNIWMSPIGRCAELSLGYLSVPLQTQVLLYKRGRVGGRAGVRGVLNYIGCQPDSSEIAFGTVWFY